jgi:hypothetical protein
MKMKRKTFELAVFNMMDSFPDEEFLDYLERPEIEAISESYEMFIQESSEKSKTFAFWSMYIRMTHTLVY